MRRSCGREKNLVSRRSGRFRHMECCCLRGNYVGDIDILVIQIIF